MPLPLVAAAGLSALASTASSVIGNEGNRRSQERANRYNLAQWHRQNAYNDPSQQMARLKAAGLNPNMVYGQSSGAASGQASPVPQSKASAYNMENPLGNLTKFADVRQREATSDNLKVQNTVLTQEAILKAAQTSETLSRGQSAKTKAEIDKALKNTSIQASKENLRTLEQGTISRELDNSFKNQALKDKVREAFYQAETARETQTGKQLDNTLKQLDIQLKRLGIEKNDPWYFRIMGRNLKSTKNKANKMLNNWKK